ncbi:interferon-inducible GTPase 5-like [Mobula hypostoma]|uniref:interferon-inducible GTPase 5-like n=1 Tax=Mobula hypostoma TaxID=723540 RepID=UPI002FC2A6EA
MVGVHYNLELAAADLREGERSLQSVGKSKSKQFTNVLLRIAVMGESATGKSTLLNALLDLNENDEGTSPIGCTENATGITSYRHPTLPNVQYCDFPGLNTPWFPLRKLMKETKFSQYDLFIIVTDGRFADSDQLLAKALKKAGKHFYLVRSKIATLSGRRAGRRNYKQEKMLQRVRKEYTSSLEASEVQNPRVFLCSAYNPDWYDFPALRETVVSNLSEAQKSLFLAALPYTSDVALQRKRNVLQRYVLILSVASGVVGAVNVLLCPLPCDLVIIASGIRFLRRCMGLDDRSLGKLAWRVGTSVPELWNDTERKFLFGDFTRNDLMLITPMALVAAGAKWHVVGKLHLGGNWPFGPILGTVVDGILSFGVALLTLKKSLDVMVESAETIMQKAEAAAAPAPREGGSY